MPKRHCYEYPRPSVTVDLVVLAWTGSDLQTLLIRRAHDPYAGRWAIPGGFLDMGEHPTEGARRELREETGLADVAQIEPIGWFADVDRDPRGRVISLAHAAVVPWPAPAVRGTDDADQAGWFSVDSPPRLAFDHDRILARALDWIRAALLEGRVLATLLPAGITPARLRPLWEAAGLPTSGIEDWLAGSGARPGP